MKKNIPPYYTINWDFNQDRLEYYDVMPYLVDCWREEKKRKHKHWKIFEIEDYKNRDKIDDTKMPETFEDFKLFVKHNSMYMFWARCEYEVIVTGWPIQKHEHKLDIYQQIKANLDVVTKHFMDYILGK